MQRIAGLGALPGEWHAEAITAGDFVREPEVARIWPSPGFLHGLLRRGIQYGCPDGLATGLSKWACVKPGRHLPLLNGTSEVRIGAPDAGPRHQWGYSPQSAVRDGQCRASFAPYLLRHMMEYGTTSAQVAAGKGGA